MLKKKSFRQNERYKKCPFFLLRAPTHHSFTFNLRFLYELMRKVRQNSVWDFIKFYIFVQQNLWTL